MKKNKAPKWWLLAIVATPLLLMLCLHIGIALGQYFGININVPGIGAADWFLFAGSYLGGAMTLLGVVATLKHERSIHRHQLMIESIEKEKALLNSIVARLDFFAPSICYTEFASALSICEWNKHPDFSSVRRRIAESMSSLNQASTDLLIGTDMKCQPAECNNCSHPCRLPAVRNEFLSLYDAAGKQLYDTLAQLDVFVNDTYQNTINDQLIALCQQEIAQCKNTGAVPTHTEKDIELARQRKVDLDAKSQALKVALQTVANLNQKERLQLINLAREYIFLRLQNAKRDCFPNT